MVLMSRNGAGHLLRKDADKTKKMSPNQLFESWKRGGRSLFLNTDEFRQLSDRNQRAFFAAVEKGSLSLGIVVPRTD
ncbi:MAG: hypothetical protein KGH94_03715 [Candidatus Micrarchaeota archaeon]|nr:hypothetical protein [Candidatus Micrarchaeota archaeon]